MNNACKQQHTTDLKKYHGWLEEFLRVKKGYKFWLFDSDKILPMKMEIKQGNLQNSFKKKTVKLLLQLQLLLKFLKYYIGIFRHLLVNG